MTKKEYVCNCCENQCELSIRSDFDGDCCPEGFLGVEWQEVDYTSIEYLQSINQPFGRLLEETQDALRGYADNEYNIEYFTGCEWLRTNLVAVDYATVYRLSTDYKECEHHWMFYDLLVSPPIHMKKCMHCDAIEEVEPSKWIEKLDAGEIIAPKINELIEAVNKLM